uniref:NADH dehydrogenase [ubiquinone] 1 beta subcomplex subunit 4 n=1 Tax=Neovison vison TaxID=452646 RepID=A0A8C7BJG2_NEOVI
MSFPKYQPLPLATLPSTLNPAEYNISLEARKAPRSQPKWEYLLQYNDPKCRDYLPLSLSPPQTPATTLFLPLPGIQTGPYDTRPSVPFT